MKEKTPNTFDVTDEELIAFANSLNVFLNPPSKGIDGEGIKQFGHLVSLLQKLLKHVYDRPLL